MRSFEPSDCLPKVSNTLVKAASFDLTIAAEHFGHRDVVRDRFEYECFVAGAHAALDIAPLNMNRTGAVQADDLEAQVVHGRAVCKRAFAVGQAEIPFSKINRGLGQPPEGSGRDGRRARPPGIA